jgi:hypothetical protein
MKATVAVLSLLLIHLMLTLSLIPLGVALGGEPIAPWCYALHFCRAAATDQFFSEYQRCWGYNPYFMAGYPAGTVFDVNNHFIEVFVHLAGRCAIPLPTAFNLLIFLAILLAPAVTWLMARNFRLTPWQQVTAVALAMLLWLLDEQVNMTWRWGIIASGMAMYFLPFSLSCFYRYWQDRTMGWGIAFLASAVFTSLLHPLSFLFSYGSVAIFVLWHARQLDRRFWGMMFVFAGVVLLVNAFWIVPFFQHIHLKMNSGFHWIGDRHALVRDLVGLDNSGLRLFLYVVAGGCLLAWWGEGRKDLTRFFLTLALILTFFGYVSGEASFFRNMETYRNNLVLSFLLIIPASVFLTTALASLRTKPYRGSLAVIALTLPIGLWACGTTYEKYAHYLLGGSSLRPLGQEEMAVIQWLRSHDSSNGRVAVEDWRLGALVPWYTGAQVVGGPYGLIWLPHNFANFAGVPGDRTTGLRLFGRKFDAFSPTDLDTYLDAYNISVVVASTDDARGLFDRQTGVHAVAAHGPYTIYQRQSPGSFLLKGDGRVQADYGRLHVTDASEGELILKYHWTHTLVVEPYQELTPHFVLDDPVPFIRIAANHCRDFVIRDGSPDSRP